MSTAKTYKDNQVCVFPQVDASFTYFLMQAC